MNKKFDILRINIRSLDVICDSDNIDECKEVALQLSKYDKNVYAVADKTKLLFFYKNAKEIAK